MKICSKCQIEYDDKFLFCKKCGSKLETMASAPNSKPSSKRPNLLIIGLVIVLALIGFFVLNSGASLTTKKNTIENDGSMILAQAKIDGKWGIIDINGDWFIQPQFLAIGDFAEGLAPALDSKTERWGFVDKTGRWVIEPKYYSNIYAVSFDRTAFADNNYAKNDFLKTNYGFSEGLAPVMTSKFNCGYIDKKGNMIINSDFTRGNPFKDGVAIVAINSNKSLEYGAINKNKKFLLPIGPGRIESYSEGLFVVETSNGYGYMKPYESYLCSDIYDEANEFSEGLAVIKVDGVAKLIDKNFQVIKDLSYIAEGDRISCYDGGFKEGKLMLTIRYGEGNVFNINKTYFKKVTIDRLGNRIKNNFRDTNGLYKLKNVSLGKYGFVDEDDNYKISPQYDNVFNFSEGVAVVIVNNKRGLIDVNGKYVKEPTYGFMKSCSNGLIVAGWDNKVGVLDVKGNIAIPNKFEAIHSFKKFKKEDLFLN